ncbi:DNA-3-methyladenine glycosylase [Gordonia sp. VNK1]|uniref:DNA-3-methyladenine glycosylase n=1 Tax=Gordonia oleivorans TaxID=3156618 RepID=UPI0032B366D1
MESLVLAMVRKPTGESVGGDHVHPDVLTTASVDLVAVSLLDALLIGHGVTVRITEVEAYAGPRDPASHAFVRTPRSEIMYGPAGRLYVYRIHGHHCANVVTGPDGEASAVLVRAGEVIAGIDVARKRRGALADAALARGPGNLARALGITAADLGTDLGGPEPVALRLPVQPISAARLHSGPRVGVRRAADVAWRFWIGDDPTVSAYRRHPQAQ